MLSLNQIHETALYVDDLPAAKAFYTDVLGLNLYAEAEGRHLFFRMANAMLLLFRPDTTRRDDTLPPHGCSGAGHVAFKVADGSLDAWRAHLSARDVSIEAEQKWDRGGESIYFRDPHGNVLELIEGEIWGL